MRDVTWQELKRLAKIDVAKLIPYSIEIEARGEKLTPQNQFSLVIHLIVHFPPSYQDNSTYRAVSEGLGYTYATMEILSELSTKLTRKFEEEAPLLDAMRLKMQGEKAAPWRKTFLEAIKAGISTETLGMLCELSEPLTPFNSLYTPSRLYIIKHHSRADKLIPLLNGLTGKGQLNESNIDKILGDHGLHTAYQLMPEMAVQEAYGLIGDLQMVLSAIATSPFDGKTASLNQVAPKLTALQTLVQPSNAPGKPAVPTAPTVT